MTLSPRPTALPTKAKVGLVLAALLGLSDIAGPFTLQTSGDEVGPPFAVVLLGAALGLVTLVFVVIGWRTHGRGAIRVVAGARILSMITALPAFFAGPPLPLVVAASVLVIVTVTAVVLMLTPPRRDGSAAAVSGERSDGLAS